MTRDNGTNGWCSPLLGSLAGSFTVSKVLRSSCADLLSSLRIASVVRNASCKISSSCFSLMSARIRARAAIILVRGFLAARKYGSSVLMRMPPVIPAEKIRRSEIQSRIKPVIAPALKREFLPVRARRILRDCETTVGTGKNRILYDGGAPAAQLAQRMRDGVGQSGNQRCTAGQNDVVAHLGLKLRFDFGEQSGHGLADGRQNAFAGSTHFLRNVDFGSLAFDRRAHDDPLFRFTDETPFLFPITEHMNRKLRVRVTFTDELHELLVDGIARVGQSLLVFFARITSLHDTESGGSGADINYQSVQ